MEESEWRVLTNCGPLEELMATSSILATENPMDSMKRQKDTMSEDGSSRSEGVQYATGKQQRAITNSSRKNEEAGPKQE